MTLSGTEHVLADTEPERFGLLLRRFRLAAGLSQERLAEAARISTEAVSALERGTRKAPQRQTLALLLDALALDAADRERLTLAAVRPVHPRLRTPRAGQPPSYLHSAPSTLTSFVGRDGDVAAIRALCASARLTSIVGAGGVGKSRLALEVAREAAASFPDGVTVVALAPLLPQAPVLPTIAAALGVRDEGAVALAEQTAASIGRRSVLLILDNCEHVLDQLAPIVEQLLADCPNLRVIATSRERLRVHGERVHRLKPLSIGHAVDVFIDRAASNGFDPAAAEADLSIAAEICDRLDRMPLAIELAASCSDVLAFGAILARLREREHLPATPARSALPQHRSMLALVEWSYGQLDPHDAFVFRHMAPFLGGCRLDDAQEILAGDTLSKDDVLYSLFRLHERSLVDADRATVPRFQMLQTIRDFATLQLEPRESATLTRGFARHYLFIVARADGDLRSARQAAAIARIAAEFTNIRVALSHLGAEPAIATPALAALGALSHYWLRTGALTEGAAIYAAVDFEQFAPTAELAHALAGAAFIEVNRQALPKAHAYATKARAVATTIRDPWLEVYAAIAERTIAAHSAAFHVSEPFEPFYRRALEIGDPWLIGSAANRMAALAQPIDAAAANAHLEYALACAESSGDAFAIQSIQLALARSKAHADPARAAEFVAAVWAGLSPAQYVPRSRCVECLADVAVVLDRLDDAAYLIGIGRSILKRIGAPDAARARFDELARRLTPAHAAFLATGEEATDADAARQVTAFVDSVAGVR